MWAVNFSPDGSRIVTSALEEDVGVWDAWTSERLLRLPGGFGHKDHAEFSRDGNLLMSIASSFSVESSVDRLGRRIRRRTVPDSHTWAPTTCRTNAGKEC